MTHSPIQQQWLTPGEGFVLKQSRGLEAEEQVQTAGVLAPASSAGGV